MNPYEVSVLDILRDGFGKEEVGFAVSPPSVLIEGDLARMVVEERPKDRIWTC